MLNIEGLIVKYLKNHIDHRGYLTECWREDDDLFEGFDPKMMYVSMSEPGVRRGAHMHIKQRDYFIFIGPGNFRVAIVDDRPNSSTYKNAIDNLYVGENNPAAIIIPTGCWHGYQNVSSKVGMVINIPDKLYRGFKYSEDVDEVRKPWDEFNLWKEIND